MENKKYIKDMNEEELEIIFNNITSINQDSYNYTYEKNMDWQNELSDILFGKNWSKYIECISNYNSFYLRIKDYREFYKNLNLNNFDYLQEDKGIEYIKLYKKAKKVLNNLNKCKEYSDKYYDNHDKFEYICCEILKILEEELHLLEEIIEQEVKEDFIFNVQENEYLNQCYILDNNYTKLYEHINYIKEYN